MPEQLTMTSCKNKHKKNREEDLSWIVRHPPPTTSSVEGLNSTQRCGTVYKLARRTQQILRGVFGCSSHREKMKSEWCSDNGLGITRVQFSSTPPPTTSLYSQRLEGSASSPSDETPKKMIPRQWIKKRCRGKTVYNVQSVIPTFGNNK